MDYRITKIFFALPLIVGAYSQDVFNTMPPPVNTNFTCRGRDTGFYADVETNCRVYHTCDDHGNKFTYYCPAETAFRQEAMICDHAHLVDCANGRRFADSKPNDEAHNVNVEKLLRNDDKQSQANRKFSSVDESRSVDDRSFDSFRSSNTNPAYTRSFRITAASFSPFSTPKSLNSKQPTFVLSSSVFLRDRGNSQKISADSRNNRVAAKSSKNIADPSNYDTRKSNENAEDEEKFYPKSLSPLSSSATFADFGASFKVNGTFKNGQNFRSRGSNDGENRMDEFFGSFHSATFATTSKPSGTDLKVIGGTGAEVTARNPSNSEFRRSNAEEDRIDEFSGNKFSTSVSAMTSRPFGHEFKVKGSNDEPFGSGKTKFAYDHEDERRDKNTRRTTQHDNDNTNSRKIGDTFGFEGTRRNDDRLVTDHFDTREHDKSSGNRRISANDRPYYFFDGSSYPYSETLRSMQSRSDKLPIPNLSTTRPPVVATTVATAATAGTEFPVHAFTGSLSPLVPNELEDDPYYPKRSTTTEVYYKLTDRQREGNKPFRFSTRRPWPGSLDFEIPEVLPDLNTLDDLVDRRKLFYIPRVKAI